MNFEKIKTKLYLTSVIFRLNYKNKKGAYFTTVYQVWYCNIYNLNIREGNNEKMQNAWIVECEFYKQLKRNK